MPVPDNDIQLCTLPSCLSLHSQQFCLCVSLSLNMWALKVVWPVISPTTTPSFCLLIAWSSCVLLDRGSLVRILDWWQPLQVFHLLRCSYLQWLLTTSLLTTNGMPTVWSEETPLFPSLANLSVSSFPGIPWCSAIYTTVTLLDTLNFASAYILSHTRANMMVVFAVLLLPPSYQSRYVFLLRSLTRGVLCTSRLPSLQLETL
jgi:hypothetical protein